MDTQKAKDLFIENEIWILTFAGAFQRSNIYKKDNLNDLEREKTRTIFREDIKTYIRKVVPQYETLVDTKNHIENLKKIIGWSNKYSSILTGGRLNVGVTQKLFNLHLKYLWCLNRIEIPPHCPFDRIIIKKLGYTNPPSWTKLNDINKYMEFVSKAKIKAQEKNISIAEWELYAFRRR